MYMYLSISNTKNGKYFRKMFQCQALFYIVLFYKFGKLNFFLLQIF